MRPVVPFLVVFLCLPPPHRRPPLAHRLPVTNTIAYPNQHERLPNAAKVTTFQFYRFYIAMACMYVGECVPMLVAVCVYVFK